MFWAFKNRAYSIGVDIGDDVLKMVQLANNGKAVSLIAGGSVNRPVDVKPGTGAWQRWAIDAVKKLISNGKFRGRNVVAAMPASEVFIDHIKMPRMNDEKIPDAVFAKIKQKLPFDAADAMIKYIPAGEDNVLVIATERTKVDRHLAIYEKANLQINSIAVWPAALANSYVSFFGRRKADIETIVMLLDIEAHCSNFVICRHKNLLFARSIPLGVKQLDTTEAVSRLVLEITACRRHFESMHRKVQIERLIFLSGLTVDRGVCAAIAKQLEMPAQMGDCLAAVEIANPYSIGIDRRGCQFSWATAFGLSLS